MSRKNEPKKPVIAVYGEHPHDARAIRELLHGLRAELSTRRRVQILKSPPTLVKDLNVATRRTRASKVVATLRALDAKDGLSAVVFHEDADRVEPAHSEVEATIRETYRDAPCPIVAAIPAWELETWWFLFPDAISAVCAQWTLPAKFLGRQVGKIPNAKEELARAVRPTGRRTSRTREYREEDCEDIARQAVSLGSIFRPTGTSDSWSRFVRQVMELAVR